MSRLRRLRLVSAAVCFAGAAVTLGATFVGWWEHADGGLVVLGSLILLLQSGDTLAELADG